MTALRGLFLTLVLVAELAAWSAIGPTDAP